MDFADFDSKRRSDEGVALTVLRPDNGEPMRTAAGEPVTVTIAGRDSRRYRRAERAMIQRRLANPDVEMTDEVVEQERARILADCVVSWSGVTLEGAELECTADNAQMMFIRFPWLADQVDAFQARRANFFETRSKA